MIDAKPLAGERILITGASSGLGAHFARLAVDAGAEVVAAARRVEALEALVAELTDAGGAAEAVALAVLEPLVCPAMAVLEHQTQSQALL